MPKTSNTIPSASRKGIIALLTPLLGSSIDLQLQAKQAHWNVKGPGFIALHEMFDKLTDDVIDWVDLIAERIVQLGGVAQGTLKDAGKNTLLSAYPEKISQGNDHLIALTAVLADYCTRIREGIDTAEGLSDKGTSDLLTEISRGADKWLWFIEAGLE